MKERPFLDVFSKSNTTSNLALVPRNQRGGSGGGTIIE